MQRIFIAILSFFFFFLIIASPGATLSSEGIVNLKKAGISDKTIQLIVREKVIETAAFSVDDLVNMKKAGVSEETLRRLINDAKSFVVVSCCFACGFYYACCFRSICDNNCP